MPNALSAETSPYLRQHAENPVDWLPWGATALQRAREQDKPLLVSIGYSSCHWCHVMERESFEDPRTAEVMNESFVCVKVDREERPDVDALYMEAVQGMTGHGGWPLNVFLTPEQLPFYGGTYFPPEPRHGLPAWTQVLHAIAESWKREPRGDPRGRGAPARAPVRRSASEAVVRADRGGRPRRRGGSAGAELRRAQRRVRPGAEVPAGLDDRVPAAAGRARHGARHPARDGRRWHTRPDRRRVRPLQRRCHLDGPPLREDALRQRAAGAGLPARLRGLGRAPAARGLSRHAGLGAARDARSRGRFPLAPWTRTPRAWRDASTCGAWPS